MAAQYAIPAAALIVGAYLGARLRRALDRAGRLVDALCADLHDVPIGEEDIVAHEEAGPC